MLTLLDSHRACVCSIMRTYYTLKFAQSPDISHNISIMGFWTWAEVAIGILICCLPIMPKFFHHFHSRFSESLTPILRRTFNSNPDSKSAGVQDHNAGVLNLFKRPLFEHYDGDSISHVLGNSHGPRNGRFVTLGSLGSFNVTTLKGDGGLGQFPSPGEGPATKRQDLEAGRYAA